MCARRTTNTRHPRRETPAQERRAYLSPSWSSSFRRALALAGESRAAGVLVSALPQASRAERTELLELLRVATGEDLGQDLGPWIRRYGGSPAEGAKG